MFGLPDLFGNGSAPVVQQGPTLNAKKIGVPGSLTSTFGDIGTNAYGTIKGNYGNAMNQAGNDASIRGATGPGSYASTRLPTQQGLDIGNLNTSMGDITGNTAYKGALNQREYNQQSQLADLIGYINRPTTLQEILSGVGVAGNVAGTGAGLYNEFGIGKGANSNTGYPDLSGGGSAYDINNPGRLDLGYGGY